MNSEEYEKALNESFNACHNLPKDTYGQIPAGYSMAFNYGYTFGMQQAKAEQKESAKREIDFQREHIAIAAMQGLLNATFVERPPLRIKPEVLAQAAVEYADALIDELNKKKDENKD